MERRLFIKGLGIIAATSVVVPSISLAADKKASATKMGIDKALAEITGAKAISKSSKVHLKAPEIAENGAVVPITIEVDSPMSDADYIKAIHVFATKNGNVRCANVMLTPANGKAFFSTRVKLGVSQDVMALVETSKGEFFSASQNVKVTIGGCG